MLEAIAQAVKAVAHEEIMPRYLRVAHSRKADGSLCTEADLAAQAALSRALTKIAPYPLLGEEMPPDTQEARWLAGGAGLWCMDPIDGTSNFVNGLPYFAVSVALFRDGRPVLGVVYAPVANELFRAETGKGAWLNDEALPIKTYVPDLRHCLAGVSFKRLNKKLATQVAGSPPFMSQRNFGASTLDWCYVAAGRFDVYLHGAQKLWDYAAGSLILQEAGGHMCSLDGGDFWSGEVWERSVVAALNEDLFLGWRNWVRSATRP
jgi:myo-inositol-1(or 4)-monophosphatase